MLVMPALLAIHGMAMLSGTAKQEVHAQDDNTPFDHVQDNRVKINGQHIRLTTDLSNQEEIASLITTFDQAVTQWREFWQLPPDALNQWVVDAYVMKDAAAFQKAGLIHPEVPDFPYGYSLGNQVYVKVQPSPYYTRHLLLHEGVHALAFDQFGGVGPVWFAEGTAEYLATHRNDSSGVTVGVIPGRRDDFPFWGRFKRMQQLREVGKRPRVDQVMKYAPNLRGDVESYAWSWTLVALLSAYPEYQPVLKQSAAHGRDSDQEFNQWFYNRMRGDWPQFQARWYNLIEDFDYGFDMAIERIDLSRDDPTWDQKTIELIVKADRGWQSAGVRFGKGSTIKLTASGDVVLHDQPKPWISHPEGVTIEYHARRPIGCLLARIVPNAPAKSGSLPALQTLKVGRELTIRFEQSSWLLLRVNDHPDQIGNNQGSYQLQIQ